MIGKLPCRSLSLAQEYFTQAKLSFCVITQHWCRTIFFWNYQRNKTNKKKQKNPEGNNYSEPSVNLTMLGCHTWWKLAKSQLGSLKVSSQDVLSSTWPISMEIRSPPLAGFSMRSFNEGSAGYARDEGEKNVKLVFSSNDKNQLREILSWFKWEMNYCH